MKTKFILKYTLAALFISSATAVHAQLVVTPISEPKSCFQNLNGDPRFRELFQIDPRTSYLRINSKWATSEKFTLTNGESIDRVSVKQLDYVEMSKLRSQHVAVRRNRDGLPIEVLWRDETNSKYFKLPLVTSSTGDCKKIIASEHTGPDDAYAKVYPALRTPSTPHPDWPGHRDEKLTFKGDTVLTTRHQKFCRDLEKKLLGFENARSCEDQKKALSDMITNQTAHPLGEGGALRTALTLYSSCEQLRTSPVVPVPVQRQGIAQ